MDMDMKQAHMIFYVELMIDERLAVKYEHAVRMMMHRDRLVDRMMEIYPPITQVEQVKVGFFLRMMYNSHYSIEKFKDLHSILPPPPNATEDEKEKRQKLDDDVALLIRQYWESIRELLARPKYSLFMCRADTSKNNQLGSASSLLFQSIEDTILTIAYDFITAPLFAGHDTIEA